MKSWSAVIPFAAWMVLMTVLPPTPWAYAVRTVVVAGLLGHLLCRGLKVGSLKGGDLCPSLPVWLWGVGAGLVVLVVWILPEQFGWTWYTKWCIMGEGGTEAIAESKAALIALRLIGSAFVISVAEELFFRKWLIPFAGFWPMVALFAIEHDRYVVGAAAGAIYGWLYLRKGLASAVIAHSVTNLALGVWVLATGQWRFW